MSLPAIRAVRERFPDAYLVILARPWVADLYARESGIARVIPYTGERGWKRLASMRHIAAELRAERFDCAILFQNAFEAAAIARLAGIPRRIGYNRDARGWLLTDAIDVPEPGEIPRHERFYYLELLRRAGILSELPRVDAIRFGASAPSATPVIGVSPGAAYGNAKRWLPERFAESAAALAKQHGATVALFGAASERELCDSIATNLREQGVLAANMAGETTLREFIELVSECLVFLTNDSGAMHIANGLGVPTVAVFGATDDTGTGPTGPLARAVREHVECSPCMLRECPIDHRCMTRVPADRVIAAANELLS